MKFPFTVSKMQERHDILSKPIGYLDEEQELTVTIVVEGLLQILFFYLYNGSFHPFANILVDKDEGSDNLWIGNIKILVMFYCFIFLFVCFGAEPDVFISYTWYNLNTLDENFASKARKSIDIKYFYSYLHFKYEGIKETLMKLVNLY